MASAQCNRPANEACQQKCQGSSSLGQKMSNWIKGSSQNGLQSKPSFQAQAQAQVQSQIHYCPNQGACKAQTHQACHAAVKPVQPQCAVKKASGHDQHTVHSHSHSHTNHQITNGAPCHCANKTSGRHSHSQDHNHATSGGVSCHGKTTMRCKHKERNPIKRIKNRISGKSNCGDSSSSSSDSESDNECCHKRKN